LSNPSSALRPLHQPPLPLPLPLPRPTTRAPHFPLPKQTLSTLPLTTRAAASPSPAFTTSVSAAQTAASKAYTTIHRARRTSVSSLTALGVHRFLRGGSGSRELRKAERRRVKEAYGGDDISIHGVWIAWFWRKAGVFGKALDVLGWTGLDSVARCCLLFLICWWWVQ
jgi:hypothetical protein